MDVKFLNKEGDFSLDQVDETSYLYFPIANQGGIMGSISPNLHGDSKIGQNSYLLEPVSSEDLHASNMGRNMWIKINNQHVWSIAGTSAAQQAAKYSEDKDEVTLTAGKLWHLIKRSNKKLGIMAEICNYCPATEEKVEIMKVTFTNIGNEAMTLLPTVAVPIYGRSADNLRDHRHVTSLLHRICVKEDGVVVKPTLSFDERGHQENDTSYGVFARDDYGSKPVGFFPVLEDFIGEGGSLIWPKAVVGDDVLLVEKETQIDGFEAMGGIRFESVEVKPGQSKTYYILLSYNEEGLTYLDAKYEQEAFKKMKKYWKNQSTIQSSSSDEKFDRWGSWVEIQPTLRRIYGCSFLPHHDYGRGGRGWRDLWQDSLALLLMNPRMVRDQLVSYYGGVRIDGSNATIIGVKPGEFIADRNSIVRVWMDHGLWPWITTHLYINQTGDADILFEENTYFKDGISHRGDKKDGLWDGKTDHLRTSACDRYKGSILEHILVQHLTAFYDVGEHNHMRLRGADWNDALDMAQEHGESVAFTAAYAGNLLSLADTLQWLINEKQIGHIEVAEEMGILINQSESLYHCQKEKQRVLEKYCDACASFVSGNKLEVKLVDLEEDLRAKAEYIKSHIKAREWVSDLKGHHWVNGYYDNNKQQIEGVAHGNVRMTLTSQVFNIMSGVTTDQQVSQIVKAVDCHLYDDSVGGYKLNTNFKEVKTDLGRMFGFAYGHKENGAVFCHMSVMYSYALYSRGFVTEAYKVLDAIYQQAMDFDISRIYPGIPEYFNVKGRGMYNYLTGSASWLILTILTQMYGIKGEYGDLVLNPKLTSKQFNNQGFVTITSNFAGKRITVIYTNKHFKEIGDYDIEEIYINQESYPLVEGRAKIRREDLNNLEERKEHIVRVVLA